MDEVVRCIKSGWISSGGPVLEEFENAWASYCGRAYGVAVSNGTAALQLAVRALDIGVGDEVILPSFTIISCALAVVYSGATPVLIDADPATWCMDMKKVEDRVTPRTRAVMPVHIYGHPCDMDPLLALAQEREIAVIEDAAEAHGAEYRSEVVGWRRCGSFGELSCFSFYANKLVTTGEGGMIVTDDPALAEKLRSLRNLSFGPERRFMHDELGFNFRLTSMQAAIGLPQVARMEQIVQRKRDVARRYQERLANLEEVSLPIERAWARSVYWMFGIVIDEGWGSTSEVSHYLAAAGIETRPFFVGMHQQPALRRLHLFEQERYPVTDMLTRQGLYLPSSPSLTEADQERVCDMLQEVLLRR